MTKPKYKMQNTKTPYRPESEPEFEADRNRDPNQFPPPNPNPNPRAPEGFSVSVPRFPRFPAVSGPCPETTGCCAEEVSAHWG